MDTIGKRIAAARKSRGLTQNELVNKITKGISILREWERDVRTPSDGDVLQIANVLSVSYEWLKDGGEVTEMHSDIQETSQPDIDSLNIADMVAGEKRTRLFEILDKDGATTLYVELIVKAYSPEEGRKRFEEY